MADAKLDEAHAQVLSEVPVVRLATLSPRGDPYVTPVRFLFDGTSLYLAVAAESEAMTHLRANRRVAVLADRPGDRIAGFLVQGLAEPVRGRAETEKAEAALAEKYPDSPDAEVGGTLMKITPLRVVDLGGSP